MKTIFITGYHGFVSRNIFNTDVLKKLRKQNNTRIIIFVPVDKQEFINNLYGGGNVLVEGVNFNHVFEDNKFWARLAFILQNTQYIKDQRSEHLWRHKTPFSYLRYYWLSFWSLILSNLPLAHKIYRYFDYRHSSRNAFSRYFEKYSPSLIFSTDVFGETDTLLLREAKSRKIFSVGMVRSWDNTTTKGILRVIPKQIIVNSPVIKEELISIHDCKENNIFIAGLPQFDDWLSGPTLNRDEFFKQIGVDPHKKLILFAPAGKILSDTDWQLCQMLKDALDSGDLPSDIQFLIRNHPQHAADLSRFKDDKRFTIELPGFRGGAKDGELTPNDNDHLRNSVYYSEIIMYIATSLGLDSSVYNKPQIIVSLDGWESKPYSQSVRRYNREDCLAGLVRFGGTRVVESKEDWIKWIKNYLAKPELDQEGRQITVIQQLYRLDSKSGERIANFIINSLV